MSDPLRVTHVFGSLRGLTFAHELGPVTALRGPTGAGKSTFLNTFMLAIYGTDGDVSVGVDIVRRYGDQAGVISAGVRFSNGTAIERTWRQTAKGADMTLAVTPSGGATGTKALQNRIVALVGPDRPILMTDLQGPLASPTERANLLAALCPPAWDSAEVRRRLGTIEIPSGIGTLDLDGLAALHDHYRKEHDEAGAGLKDAAGAAREHQLAATDLDAVLKACPYSKPDLDAAEKALAEYNTAIALAEAKATEREQDTVRIAEIEAEIAKAGELPEVDVEAAEAAYQKALDEKRKCREKKLKGIDHDLKELKKQTDSIESEQAVIKGVIAQAEQKVRDTVERRHAIERGIASIEAVKKQFESFECPKCRYAGQDEIENAETRIAEEEKAALGVTAELEVLAKQLFDQNTKLDERNLDIARIRKEQDARTAERNRVTAFPIEDHPDVKPARADLDKAKQLTREREAAAAALQRLAGERDGLAAKLAVPPHDLDGLRAEHAAHSAKVQDIRAALTALAGLAASLEASALSVKKAEGLRVEVENAAVAAKRIQEIRTGLTAASLDPFVESGGRFSFDPAGRTFAVKPSTERNRTVLKVGVRDQDGIFFDFEQLSHGEQVCFALSFMLAVADRRGSPFRPVLLDDLNLIRPDEHVRRLIERIHEAVEAGLASQALVAGEDAAGAEWLDRIEFGKAAADA